jgi:hypothetical protein
LFDGSKFFFCGLATVPIFDTIVQPAWFSFIHSRAILDIFTSFPLSLLFCLFKSP